MVQYEVESALPIKVYPSKGSVRRLSESANKTCPRYAVDIPLDSEDVMPSPAGWTVSRTVSMAWDGPVSVSGHNHRYLANHNTVLQ